MRPILPASGRVQPPDCERKGPGSDYFHANGTSRAGFLHPQFMSLGGAGYLPNNADHRKMCLKSASSYAHSLDFTKEF